MNQNTPNFRWIAILLGMMTLNLSFSMPEDKEKTANLFADSADLNQQTHRGEYSGHVRVDQGTTHLRAEKAITQGDRNNKLILAIAFGDKTKPVHYWVQTAVDKPLLHAYADKLYYYPKRHLITLVGHARIIQGKDSLSAPKISYNTLEQRLFSKGNPKDRVMIILHPDKKMNSPLHSKHSERTHK